jgi:hypothetical protein
MAHRSGEASTVRHAARVAGGDDGAHRTPAYSRLAKVGVRNSKLEDLHVDGPIEQEDTDSR